MMSDKKVNIIKAIFCFFIAIGCLVIVFMGVPGRGRYYPIAGVALGIFLGVGFLKKAFDKY